MRNKYPKPLSSPRPEVEEVNQVGVEPLTVQASMLLGLIARAEGSTEVINTALFGAENPVPSIEGEPKPTPSLAGVLQFTIGRMSALADQLAIISRRLDG